MAGRQRLFADSPDLRRGPCRRILPSAIRRAESEGKTAVTVGWDGQARGVLVVADAVKPTSAEAVKQLRALGLTPIMLTGDNEAAAATIARHVGYRRSDRRGAARRQGRRPSNGCRPTAR